MNTTKKVAGKPIGYIKAVNDDMPRKEIEERLFLFVKSRRGICLKSGVIHRKIYNIQALDYDVYNDRVIAITDDFKKKVFCTGLTKAGLIHFCTEILPEKMK